MEGREERKRKKGIQLHGFVESHTDSASGTEQDFTNKRECLTVLRNLFAETLLLEPAKVDADKKFLEQGLDSILGMEYIQKINGKFGLNLRGTVLYEHPTLIELNAHILADCPQILKSKDKQITNFEKCIKKVNLRIHSGCKDNRDIGQGRGDF